MLRWLKFSVVALVGCGFIGMIGYALWMRDAIRSAQLEPPLIAAPDSPVKRRPESPGGMEIPNRDKLVFDLLDNSASVTAPPPAPADEIGNLAADNSGAGAATPAVTAETASTTTGQPVANVAARVAPKDSDATGSAGNPVANSVSNPVADQLALARLAADSGNDTPAAGSVSPAAGTVTGTAAHALTPVSTTAKAIAKTTVAKPVATAAASTATPVANLPAPKGYGVQVGAVGSVADAQRLAASLQAKYPPLKALTPHTQSVTASNGTHVRVQFFGAADRVAAQKVCGQLGKQPCFVVGG